MINSSAQEASTHICLMHIPNAVSKQYPLSADMAHMPRARIISFEYIVSLICIYMCVCF